MSEEQFEELIKTIGALNEVNWYTIILTILGSLISAFVAFKVAKYQVDKSKQQQQEQMDENRRLEKELFFYKSRHDALGACINALDEVIDSFQKAFSTSRAVDRMKASLDRFGKEGAIDLLVNEIYGPIDKIAEFEAKYIMVIWRSYFDDESVVSIERKANLQSNALRKLFNQYDECIRSLVKEDDFDTLSYALEHYIFNELMILQHLYLTIYKINSLYFSDERYVKVIVEEILKSYRHETSFMESEKNEWKLLLEKRDISGIVEKRLNMMSDEPR